MKRVSTLFALAPVAPFTSGFVPQQQPSGESNLPFLFVAYTITWLAFFGYALYMSRKQQALRRELDALRKQLEQKNPPSQDPGIRR